MFVPHLHDITSDARLTGRIQAYQRANLITTEELALVKKIAQQPKAKIESLLLTDGQTCALLYLRLLKKLQRVDTQQCILVWFSDMLTGECILHRRLLI